MAHAPLLKAASNGRKASNKVRNAATALQDCGKHNGGRIGQGSRQEFRTADDARQHAGERRAGCDTCGHAADVNVEGLAETVTVPEAGRRLRCRQCGGKQINTRPAMAYRARRVGTGLGGPARPSMASLGERRNRNSP
jgi:hypothetical protein